MVHVNGKKVGGNANICKFTAYVSPYFVVSNGGAYTKHIYAASQRIASKLGNVDGFGADPRRVEMAGGKKYDDNQSGTIKARFEALNIDYSDGNGKKDDEEYEPTMDSEEPENLVFFYHPDHLGSTSYVTDADGNIAQHIEYIPYGEVFVEERNNSFSTNFLFNAKELDNETGLYYYGARYLDPTGAMWLSVDPMWEKYAGMSPYNYCAGNPVKLVDPDGRNVEALNQDDSQNMEYGMYVYIKPKRDEKGAFFKKGYDGKVDKSTPYFSENCPSFMKKLGESFEEMCKTDTGWELFQYFSDDNHNATFQRSYNENAINVDGNHLIFINTARQDIIPTILGDDSKWSPLWISVGHEMAHRMDYYLHGDIYCNMINYNNGELIFGGERRTEIFATRMENRMRAEAGLPLRTFYNANNPQTQLLQHVDIKVGKTTTRCFTPRSLYENSLYPIPFEFYFKLP